MKVKQKVKVTQKEFDKTILKILGPDMVEQVKNRPTLLDRAIIFMFYKGYDLDPQYARDVEILRTTYQRLSIKGVFIWDEEVYMKVELYIDGQSSILSPGGRALAKAAEKQLKDKIKKNTQK